MDTLPQGRAESHVVARLLERLTRVTKHGANRWRAVCPAHESRHHSQTLAIRELPDGTVLIRCHAGCGAGAIVDAVNLKLADLFSKDHRPKNDEPRSAQSPNHYHAARAALETIASEAVAVVLVGEDIATGKIPSEADLERCALATSRIRFALEGVL